MRNVRIMHNKLVIIDPNWLSSLNPDEIEVGLDFIFRIVSVFLVPLLEPYLLNGLKSFMSVSSA